MASSIWPYPGKLSVPTPSWRKIAGPSYATALPKAKSKKPGRPKKVVSVSPMRFVPTKGLEYEIPCDICKAKMALQFFETFAKDKTVIEVIYICGNDCKIMYMFSNGLA